MNCAYRDKLTHNNKCLYWKSCKFGGDSGMM